LKVWFDKDDLAAGAPWQRRLEQIITEGCTAFAVYVGSKGVMNWVESEVSLSLSRATTDKSFPFIPILAQKSTAAALPPFAALYQAVRDPLNDPAEMEKFLKAILEPRGPVVILDEPFVGLRAMTEADAARFFGRTWTSVKQPLSLGHFEERSAGQPRTGDRTKALGRFHEENVDEGASRPARKP
jgi:hypothetical protein